MSETDLPDCPVPFVHDQMIVLGHGSGGRLTADLIQRVFLKYLHSEFLHEQDDAAVLPPINGRPVISTDSYVVNPIFFKGGDIGSLAVNGTINDLVVRGATPKYLTAAFILEEGLLIDDLERIVRSMSTAAADNSIVIVAADTKVVNRGAGDKIFINTTGLGELSVEQAPGAEAIKPDDVVIVSGDIGRHGMAIMCERAGLELESEIESDCASLLPLVRETIKSAQAIHCMRDLTRGGLGTILNELATSAKLGIEIYETSIPVNESVAAACDLLGLDPLYVACEGRMVLICPQKSAQILLPLFESQDLGRSAAIIGNVTTAHAGVVVMHSLVGGRRIVDKLSGEQLPRIC